MQESPYLEFQMNSLDTWYNYAPGLHGAYTHKNYFCLSEIQLYLAILYYIS